MSNKKENFYGITIVSTTNKLDSVFKSRMLDYDNYPDYYRYVHIGTLYLKDGQTIDGDEEAVFEIMEQDKDKSLEIKAYVENKLAGESASYKHPVYMVTSSYNGDEMVHTLRSHSIRHSRGQLLLGFYMKEEDAIAVAEKEWEQKGNWLTRLKVPYAIYRTHIKDFKVCEYGCPKFHAHKGYSKKDWQVTEDEVSLAERLYDSYNCTAVCKYETTDAPLMLESDCQELKNEVVWRKCRLETKLLPFEEAGKWGFRDKATGLVVVKPKYDDCQSVLRDVDLSPNYDEWYYMPPTDKFTCVKKKGKQGIVNEFGVEIIPTEYDGITIMEVVEEKRENYCFKVIKNSRYGLVSSRGEFILPLIYGSLTRDYCYYYELYVTVRLNEHMIGFEVKFDDFWETATLNECGAEKKQPKPVVRMQDLSADGQAAFRRRRDLFYGSIPLIYSKRINPPFPFPGEFFGWVVAPIALFDSVDGGAIEGEQITLKGLMHLWENTNGLFRGICGKCGGKTDVVHVTGDPASDAIKEKVSVCPQCGAIIKESTDDSFSALIAERGKCKDETWHHHASPERLAAVFRGDVKFEAEVSDRWDYPVVSGGSFDEAAFEAAFSGGLSIVKWDKTELDLRKRVLNEQFVWTEDAKQGVLQLNRILLMAAKLAKTEKDRGRDWEFTQTLSDKTFNCRSPKVEPKLELAIEEKDKNGRWERCYYGVYGDLNRFLYTDGSINDSKVEKWETYPTAELPNLIGSAAAAHFAGIDAEWSFGLHALWHYTPLAWEDILKIRTVRIEAKCEYERFKEFKIFRQKKKNSSN